MPQDLNLATEVADHLNSSQDFDEIQDYLTYLTDEALLEAHASIVAQSMGAVMAQQFDVNTPRKEDDLTWNFTVGDLIEKEFLNRFKYYRNNFDYSNAFSNLNTTDDKVTTERLHSIVGSSVPDFVDTKDIEDD